MNYRISIILLVAFIVSIGFVSADLSADQKKALEGISATIDSIQSSVMRCEEDVCRQVSENADHREGLIREAMDASEGSDELVRSVQEIVREDIAALERCESDVCREVLRLEQSLLADIGDYLDLDSDGDGVPESSQPTGADALKKGDRISNSTRSVVNSDTDTDGRVDVQVGASSSFSISKRSARTDRSSMLSSGGEVASPAVIYTLQSRGGGAGKVSLNELKQSHVDDCPRERCVVELEIEVRNNPPVASRFSEGFDDVVVGVDERDQFTFGFDEDTVCSQQRSQIHCRNEEEVAIVGFSQDTEVRCESHDNQLYCWGNNERAETEQQVVFEFDSFVFDGTAGQRAGSAELPDSCIAIRDSCPQEAQADGTCIVTSEVCGPNSSERCIELARECPGDTRADGSCVAVADVCGQGSDRAQAGGACPDGEALCMNGECESLFKHPRCGGDLGISSGEQLASELSLEEAQGRAIRCSNGRCVSAVADRCEDDVCVAGIAGLCPDDSCVAGVVEHCSDDVCRQEARAEYDAASPYLARVARSGDDRASPYIMHNISRGNNDNARSARARAARDKATPLLYQGLSARDLSEDDRRGIGEYLRNATELRGEDFGLAVAYAVSNNSRVRSVRYDNSTGHAHVEHESRVRLFGFIPMSARAQTTFSAEAGAQTDYPWWAVLASKVDPEEMELAVEKIERAR